MRKTNKNKQGKSNIHVISSKKPCCTVLFLLMIDFAEVNVQAADEERLDFFVYVMSFIQYLFVGCL